MTKRPRALWGGPAKPPCFLVSFRENAIGAPDQVAVQDGNRRITYSELAAWVVTIRDLLVAHGVQPNDRIAVTGPRCPDTIAAMLAVVSAGAIYVPLDREYPAVRITHMLTDSDARLVLWCADDAPPASGLPAIPVPAQPFPATGQVTGHKPVPCCAESGVYVIYTSGSTGWPKGVQLPHRCVDNMVEWQRNHSISRDIRTAQFAPLNFDVCFQEILGTLCGGGTLVITPERLRQDSFGLLTWLVEERVERLFLPYLGLQMLSVAAARDVAVVDELALREVNVAGEQLICTDSIRQLFARLPHTRLNNHYGQSESAMVTVHTLAGSSESWPTYPPIGAPLPGCEVLVDAYDDSDPGSGELLVAGLPLSSGYLNQPELNATRYVDLATPHSHRTVFRTGDAVRLEDGVLRMMGRIDQQVKIRGYRVDLLEIDSCLLSQAGISEAAAAVARSGQTPTLVAAVALDPDLPLFDEEGLLHALGRRLPAYSVPVSITVLPAVPRTPSGKIDRLAVARGFESRTS